MKRVINMIGMLSLGILISLAACKKDELGPPLSNPPPTTPSNTWSIPVDEVLDGGPGKDGIPSIDNPQFVTVQEADVFLEDNDLVVAARVGDDIRVYPHIILDWHEIVNDEVGGLALAIIYCPLTGTTMGWERTVNGWLTEFGVSGLLYQTNLMPYDRQTNSTWSQMLMKGVNGPLIEKQIEVYQTIETSWKTWKAAYPEAAVLSLETGFSRNYGRYPYGGYRTNNNFLFPINKNDSRLAAKERVLGVIFSERVLAFRFDEFNNGTGVVQTDFEGLNLVVAGNQSKNLMVAYSAELEDGTLLAFEAVDEIEFPTILRDQEGTSWDVFGYGISGPRMGQELPQVISLMGYWFTFPTFYDSSIYEF